MVIVMAKLDYSERTQCKSKQMEGLDGVSPEETRDKPPKPPPRRFSQDKLNSSSSELWQHV